jgi:hypothetical protein
MNKYIGLNEAIELCMRHGMSRRQAKRWLIRHAAKGNIRTSAVIGTAEGFSLGREELPPEFWQEPWRDVEGDSGDPNDSSIDNEVAAIAKKARTRKGHA